MFNLITQEKLNELMRSAPEELRYANPITAFDVETPNVRADRLCSIGLTLVEQEKITDSFEYLVYPDTYFDDLCVGVHGITPERVEEEPEFPAIWDRIRPFFEDRLILAHNACFDLNVLKRLFQHYGIEQAPVRYADTVQISRAVYGKLMPNHKLGTLCRELGIDLDAHHAGSDSYGCAALYLRMLAREGDLKRFEKVFRFD